MNLKLDFINGDTKKCLATMALPLMAALFLNMAYNLVDSLWIGNLLGERAYAALTNATPVILILNSIAMGASNGVSILLSQAVGAGKKETAEKMITTSLLAAIVFSLGLTLLLELLLRPILGLLGTPDELMPMAYQYLAILFYPAMAFNMALTSIVGQCTGAKRYDRARDYMKASLLSGTALLLVLSALVTGFARPLALLFVDSSQAAEIVAVYFRIVGAGYLLNTLTNCFLGSLNGMGRPAQSLLCMVLYYLVVRMPLAWLLSHLGFGLEGIWTAVLISHVIAAAASAFAALRQLRDQKAVSTETEKRHL